MSNIIDMKAKKEALNQNLIPDGKEINGELSKMFGKLQPCPSQNFSPGELPVVDLNNQAIEKLVNPLNTLTDEQINTISDVLKENMSDDAKKISEFASNNGIEENDNGGELTPVEANVIVNPIDGTHMVSTEPVKLSESSITDIMNLNSHELDIRNIDVKEDSFKKIQDTYGIADKDVHQLISIILRVKSGEKFNIYNAMPESIKTSISQTATGLGNSNPQTLNFLAKELVNEYIREMMIDQEFIDFQKSLEKELDIPNIASMYQDYQKDLMENTILERANKIREQYPDKADKLIKISEAFKNARTFNNLKYALRKNKKLKLRSSDLNAYARYCKEFNFKYEKSKFMINDISIIGPILGRKLKDATLTDIERFVVVFCKFTSFMSPNNIEEHAFMYYVIKNIMALDYVDDSSEFSKEMISNVIEVIQLTKNMEV